METALGFSPSSTLAEAAKVFRQFAQHYIAPHAAAADRDERLTEPAFRALIESGYIGAAIPSVYGGLQLNSLSYGLLHAAVGQACTAARTLLTVHGMVSSAVARWGSQSQRQELLPDLATGRKIGALALSEPSTGSDAANVQTSARLTSERLTLNGIKKWISFGQLADLFLVLARCDSGHVAALVERGTPGLEIRPISGLLGVRGACAAELQFTNCSIPIRRQIGREGLGYTHVFAGALDHGRYSVAWGCVGMIAACVEQTMQHVVSRQQFGVPLIHHQLVRHMVTDMFTGWRTAQLLCEDAANARTAGDPDAIMKTMVAKYHASTTATRVSADAVQLHGASGCTGERAVERHFRDAKVMEIIEGSSQMCQINIAEYAVRAVGLDE